MQIARFRVATLTTIIIIILTGLINIHPGISFSVTNVTIYCSGSIGFHETRPLHVEGRYVKNDLGQIVYLRGAYKWEFTDTCTGLWTPVGQQHPAGLTTFSEDAVRAHFQTMRQWGFNALYIGFCPEWWIKNSAVTLDGAPTDVGCKYAMKRTTEIALEEGIYLSWRGGSSRAGEGHKYLPFPATGCGNCHDGSIFADQQDWIDFWLTFMQEYSMYPNVIFHLYDEPVGDYNIQTIWFDAVEQLIISARALGIRNIIQHHWAYCGGWEWLDRWYSEERPLDNVMFTNHIYRHDGTFENNPLSPTDYEYVKAQLGQDWRTNASVPFGRTYLHAINDLNASICCGATGAFDYSKDGDPAEYARELECFTNILKVLNEWQLGYVAYQWQRTDWYWPLQRADDWRLPNEAGQILINAISGT